MHVLENGRLVDDGNYMTLNGGGAGEFGSRLAAERDPGLRRPFIHPKNNKPYVVVNSGRFTVEKGVRTPIREAVPVARVVNEWNVMNEPLMTANATALPALVWRQIDEAVLREPRLRLRAYADLSAANSVGGFDAYGKATFEYQVMTDPGEAVMSFDGAAEDERNDAPTFGIKSTPLPLTSAGFKVTDRQLAISRNGGAGMAFDTSGAEWCGRRVSETVEKRTIGLGTAFSYGTRSTGVEAHIGSSTVWGYLDHPDRNTKNNFTAPTAGGWDPEDTVNELLIALETLAQDRYYGPFILYHSTDWDQYLDGDYWSGTKAAGLLSATRTLRDRIKQIAKIQDIRRLDFLEASANPFTLILVQMTPDVARAINGRGITTVQWATRGGMQIEFLIYCIWVPQVRSTYSGRSGVLVGTTS